MAKLNMSKRSGRHAIILIGGIAAMSLMCSLRSSARSAGEAMTLELLRRVALAVLSLPDTSTVPFFSVRKQTVYYYLGEVVLPDALPVSGIVDQPIGRADPLRIPVRDQARIELLRTAIRRETGFELFEPAIDRAERVVEDELALIAKNSGTREALLDALDEKSLALEALLDRRMSEVATERRLNLYKTTRKSLGDTHEVTFVSVPAGGVISVVLDFDFRASLKAAKAAPWRVVSQTAKVSLPAGSYRVRVVWPTSKGAAKADVSECTIDIMTDGPLELRPMPTQACS